MSEQVFAGILNDLASVGSISKDHMENLFAIFSEELFNILPLLTQGNVKKLQTPSERFLFSVHNGKTEKSKDYCLIAGNLCSCDNNNKLGPASVDTDLTWCNHLVAAKISAAIKNYEIVSMSEEDFQEVMCRLVSYPH